MPENPYQPPKEVNEPREPGRRHFNWLPVLVICSLSVVGLLALFCFFLPVIAVMLGAE